MMAPKFLRSKFLEPLPHGFFTRLGGVSEGAFATLNCGERSIDLTEHVAENRRRVAASLMLPADRLVTAVQTHSAHVEVIDSVPKAGRPAADGLVTNLPDIAVGVLTADCQPVLLVDHEAEIVAAVHAGWPGTLGGIIENAVDKMERLGARRSKISAAVGPAISQENYEVGEEFRERFISKDDRSSRFFRIDRQGSLRFDLPGYGMELLRRSEVGRVEWLGHCTYGDSRRFYSFRRSCHLKEKNFGLQISAIAARRRPLSMSASEPVA